MHRWRIEKATLFPDSLNLRYRYPETQSLHGTYLFPNGDVLVNLSRVGTVRLDACGRVQWRLPEGSHHSIARAEDGSFWIPGTSARPRRTSTAYPDGYPGLDEPVWIEELLQVSAAGTLLQRINVLDVLYANGLERHFVKEYQPEAGTAGPHTKDLLHLNDVEPLPSSMADEYPLFDAGDLLVSLRNPNLVFVFDPASKRAKWHASTPFIQQHDPDFIGEGWIGIFDNNEDFTERGTMLGGSRIVALQPHTDSIEIRFPTEHSTPFYTAIRGKWQA
ncbi:MAG: arylsulfotransferase family protein, partial [Salinibacter sp.]